MVKKDQYWFCLLKRTWSLLAFEGAMPYELSLVGV